MIAVVVVVMGMVWGIAMAVSGDFATMPAHAHLNLLGWVSLFLFGVFYRLHPQLDRSRTARLQVWVWIAGTVILTIGVGMLHSGQAAGEPLAGVGSVIVLADILLFGWLVLKYEWIASFG
jgi:hypothetical protein